jgi:hypothetical protein
MEIDEFIETDTGKKTIKEIESLKKDLYDNWGYSTEELHHIELCMLKLTTEIYMMAEDWEERAQHNANIINKYRKIMLDISNAIGAKSPVVDSTSIMEEAMFYTLPEEARRLKERVDWHS